MSYDPPSPANAPGVKERLAPFRREIDALDDRIVALLGARFGVVREVAALKAEYGIDPVLPDRIDEVIDRTRRAAEGADFDPAICEQIYRILLGASCQLEADFIAAKDTKPG